MRTIDPFLINVACRNNRLLVGQRMVETDSWAENHQIINHRKASSKIFTDVHSSTCQAGGTSSLSGLTWQSIIRTADVRIQSHVHQPPRMQPCFTSAAAPQHCYTQHFYFICPV